MVNVSLLLLCRVQGSFPVWPEEFAALVARCEADLVDRLPFGVLADWCDDKGEPELASAFRWLHKRPEVRVIPGQRDYSAWSLADMPKLMGWSLGGEGGHGFIGLVVALADRLTELRRDLA